MQIYGNPNLSDKFFVYLEDNSINYVRDFETAKGYIQNPNYKKWFGKTLYCTNEDIVKAYDGKLYLKSKVPENPNEIKIYDNKSFFINNCKKYIENTLNDLSIEYGYVSFYQLISWKDSKILKNKQLAEKMLNYRDKLYNFYSKIYNKHKKQLENTSELLDLSNIYTEFLENIPKFKKVKENETNN